MGGPGSGPKKRVSVDDFEHPHYNPDFLPPAFEGVTFPALISAQSIRLNANGDLLTTFLVPSDQVDEAMKLRWAALNGGLVAVRVEPWHPFENQLAREAEIEDEFSGRVAG